MPEAWASWLVAGSLWLVVSGLGALLAGWVLRRADVEQHQRDSEALRQWERMREADSSRPRPLRVRVDEDAGGRDGASE